MITAQEEDRARIARDLHDDISQRLHAAAIGVDPALRAMATDQDDATERLQAIQEQLDGVAEDARKISHELHPATLEILGLASAIEGLGEDFEAISGITTRVEAPESVQELASTQVSLCLYRITQEALRNIAKHANAKNVDVELWAGADTIRLRIHDDGVGFDQKGVPAGLGLASMRERARLLGGKLTVDSEPGAGTELTVELPVQGEDR
jgi:signal transduction histidine kinase